VKKWALKQNDNSVFYA